MGLDKLNNAENSVLIALAKEGRGSTSQNLAYGFVTGKLTVFDGLYLNLEEAWNRLDIGQQDAVIAIRHKAKIGKHNVEVGGVVAPSRAGFVESFVKWKRHLMLCKLEDAWLEKTDEDYLPSEVFAKHNEEVDRELAKHL